MTAPKHSKRVAKGTLVLNVARALAVMFAAPIALLSISAAGFLSAGRALRQRRVPHPAALAACAATALYLRFVRPWHLRWGSAPEDAERQLPGHDLLPSAGTDIVHAVTINAPAEDVWPWVAQLGQDRGGFYSYEWLENLAGCEMRNADRIHPEWQDREVGETVYLHPLNGLQVTVFEPGRALGLEGWGTVVVEPVDANRSRLIVRGRVPRGTVAAGYAALMEVPHFVMERRMLLGIKQRAERGGPVRSVVTT